MLLIYGMTFIVLAACLTAAAGLIFNAKMLSSALRRAVAGQVFCVVLASLIGIGMVALLAFLTEFETQRAIPLQVTVAAVLATAGYGAVWFLARRTPPPSITVSATVSPKGADPQRHAA